MSRIPSFFAYIHLHLQMITTFSKEHIKNIQGIA